MPQRIQLRRSAGWRKPAGVIVVARPGQWGNPWRVTNKGRIDGMWAVHHESNPDPAFLSPNRVDAIRFAVHRYSTGLSGGQRQRAREQLAGRDLACWCSLSQSCHADVLLEIANPDDPHLAAAGLIRHTAGEWLTQARVDQLGRSAAEILLGNHQAIAPTWTELFAALDPDLTRPLETVPDDWPANQARWRRTLMTEAMHAISRAGWVRFSRQPRSLQPGPAALPQPLPMPRSAPASAAMAAFTAADR